MRFATLFALTTPLLVVADLSLNSVHGGNHGVNKRHHANRDSALSQRDEAHITLHQNRKRFSGARATFYDVGLGACGNHNSRGDFIVALNTHQYGSGYPGPQCGKGINIHYKGKTAHAVIQDECPGCPFGALDMSRGLFDFFEDESAGVFTMSWEFADGSGGGSAPAPHESNPNPPNPNPPKPEPKPEPKPKAEPTTHSEKKPDPTTTKTSDKPQPTKTKDQPKPSTTDNSNDNKKSSTSTTPTPSPAPVVQGGNLDDIAEALQRMGQLVMRGQASGN